uniref:Uncharacterized protein n=1 Tax=viral metagenome TaxID=1070528 RepID=A0A6C0H617_9ZZZZ
MQDYIDFYQKYKDIANIYIVYILEAHFVEKDENQNIIGGWPIGKQYNYPQHKSINDRYNMVNLLIDEFHPNIPILMDNMNNDFQNIYNPWPDKAFMFFQNKIKYISQVNDDGSRYLSWTTEISTILDKF